MNKVKILVISEKRSENIFEPQTMNFAVGTLFCDFLDFRQFTVEIQARIIQKIMICHDVAQNAELCRPNLTR